MRRAYFIATMLVTLSSGTAPSCRGDAVATNTNENQNVSENQNANNKQSACEGVSCKSWQECVDGACVLKEGACENYLDCADDEFCSEDHLCLGPTQPGDTFFEPLQGNWVAFEFHGLINSEADAAAQNVVQGTGWATTHLDNDDQDYSDMMGAYRYHVPETSSATNLADKDTVALFFMQMTGQEGNTYHYLYFYSYLTIDQLQALAAAGPAEVPVPSGFGLRVYQSDYTVRSFDQALFSRTCLVTGANKAATASRIFINSWNNRDFSAGENIHLWANVSLDPPTVISPDNEGQYCGYAMNSQPITKEEYEEGLAQTEPELSCDIPDGFLDPDGSDWLSLIFVGPINDGSQSWQNLAAGAGSATATIDGTDLAVGDQYEIAALYTNPEQLVFLYAKGGTEQLGPNHYAYHDVQLSIPQRWLQAVKANGQTTVPFDPDSMSVLVDAAEQIIDGNDYWTKMCPTLIFSQDSSDGTIILCSENNDSFAIGEQLEIALSIPMTSDATAIHETMGTREDCFCYHGHQIVDCSEFDAL